MFINFRDHPTKNKKNALFFVTKDQHPDHLKKSPIYDIVKLSIDKIHSSIPEERSAITFYLTGIWADYETVTIFYISDIEKNDYSSLQKLGSKVTDHLNNEKIEEIDIFLEHIPGLSISIIEMASAVASGIKLKNYAFTKYFADKKSKHVLALKTADIIIKEYTEASRRFEEENAIVTATLATRDLVSEPANILYPESFKDRCEQLKELGVTVTVLDNKKMAKLGMNLLLGVAQGSAKEPYTVILEWKGGKKDDKFIAIAGKGVCFDTGGINIKTSNSIVEMKYDMAGADVAFGVMHAIAQTKAKVNLVCALGLVENMPSGTAQRPSDVLVSMSGQTVEIDNTDAEGRLVLADILWYLQKQYAVQAIIDVATLTGAIGVALGDIHAGIMSNDDNLAEGLIAAGKRTAEPLWRLPLGEQYDRQVNSEIADVKNTGSGRGGGAITAAQFLQRFIMPKIKWAHLDIAAMAWTKTGHSLVPKGATGFGVRLLLDWITKRDVM